MSKLLTTRNCYNDVSYFEMTSERRSFLVLDKDRSETGGPRTSHLYCFLIKEMEQTNLLSLTQVDRSSTYFVEDVSNKQLCCWLCSIDLADIEQLTYGLDAFDNAKGKGP